MGIKISRVLSDSSLLPKESRIIRLLLGFRRWARSHLLQERLIAQRSGFPRRGHMSRIDTALLIAAVVVLLVFLPPTGEFFFLFLRRLSIAGFAAVAALAALLLLKFLKR